MEELQGDSLCFAFEPRLGGAEEMQREGHVLLFHQLVETCDDSPSAHASGALRRALSFCHVVRKPFARTVVA